MNPYALERLAAERQADYMRELGPRVPPGRRAGWFGHVVAAALRGAADRLDGAGADARRGQALTGS